MAFTMQRQATRNPVLPIAFLLTRVAAASLFISLLTGCATTEGIRGILNYDLRPEAERSEVFMPWPPEIPHYRYVGELVGEPNFQESDKAKGAAVTVLKLVVGAYEVPDPVLLLKRPKHGAVGDDGRIYVVDDGRNAVLVFDPRAPREENSGNGEGQLLKWEFAEAGKRFIAPVAVTLVWDGEIAVSDATLGVVVTLNDKGVPIGNFGGGRLQRPGGLAFDREHGLLFVADTVANDIKVFTRTGQLVNTLGSAGDDEGEFNAPTQLAFSHGRLYVSDTYNRRIQSFETDGHHFREFGEHELYLGNTARPRGIAVGDDGTIYVIDADSRQLLAFTENEELLTSIHGSGMRGGDFLLPSGVWTDRQGRVFVADGFNSRVVVFQRLKPAASP